MELRLKILIGNHAGKEMRVAKEKFLVGRSAECHLRPNSEKISRHHCVLLLVEGRVTIRDLGSRNGTLVNGEKIIGEVELAKGDLLEIGPLQFEVALIAGAASEAKLPVEVATRPSVREVAREAPPLQPTAAPVEKRRPANPERARPEPAEDIATWLLDSLAPKGNEDTKDFSKTDIFLKPQAGSGAPPLPADAAKAEAEALKKLNQKRRR